VAPKYSPIYGDLKREVKKKNRTYCQGPEQMSYSSKHQPHIPKRTPSASEVCRKYKDEIKGTEQVISILSTISEPCISRGKSRTYLREDESDHRRNKNIEHGVSVKHVSCIDKVRYWVGNHRHQLSLMCVRRSKSVCKPSEEAFIRDVMPKVSARILHSWSHFWQPTIFAVVNRC
jgi:hypothetical protein